MEKIKSVKPLPGYQLEISFTDGSHGIISLKDRLFGPVFEPLKDMKLFGQVGIDEFGAICWPNGADLAPDAVYEKLKSVHA
jgi:hypothetical protein